MRAAYAFIVRAIGRVEVNHMIPIAMAALIIYGNQQIPGASTPRQQKYRLISIDEVGDRYAVDDLLQLSAKIRVTGAGQGEQTVTLTAKSHEQYTEEPLASVRGRMTAYRRTYTISRSEATGLDGKLKSRTPSLMGRTITVRRVGEKIVITHTGKGKVDP